MSLFTDEETEAKKAKMLSQTAAHHLEAERACSLSSAFRGHHHPSILKWTPRRSSSQKNPLLTPTSAIEKGIWIR